MTAPNNQIAMQLPMFVVDVLRYDIEQVPSITKLLNNTGSIGWRKFWPHDFTDKEVVGALGRLCNEGLVEVLVYDPQLKELVVGKGQPDFEGRLVENWFRLNDAGRRKWEEWRPPTESK